MRFYVTNSIRAARMARSDRHSPVSRSHSLLREVFTGTLYPIRENQEIYGTVVHPPGRLHRYFSPFVCAFYYLVGRWFLFYAKLCMGTCKIEFRNAPPVAQYIFLYWHSYVWEAYTLYGTFYKTLHCFMCHPLLYMRPIQLLSVWMGVDLVLGASGANGQEALERVISWLKRGRSIQIPADGPYGPLHQLKPGALRMSIATGVPVVPVRFEVENCLRLGGWDQKAIPLPFLTKITAHFGPPLRVREGNVKRVAAETTAFLNGTLSSPEAKL